MPAIKYKIGDKTKTREILDIDRTRNPKKIYWKVRCLQCGKIDWVRTDSLNRQCKHCGNLHKTSKIYDDLTNRTFGFWKVLYKADKPNYWHCKCQNCGTERDVFRGNLINGLSTSCGCINSKGEYELIKLLNKYQIKFETQYSFNDLVGKNNQKLKFDFAIFKNSNLYCLIEFDGYQHFKYNNNWNTSLEKFKRIQELDELKNIYCITHNILLYRLKDVSLLETFTLKLKEELNYD